MSPPVPSMRLVPICLTAGLMMATASPSQAQTPWDRNEHLLGATYLSAQSGNGRLTVGVGPLGEVAVDAVRSHVELPAVEPPVVDVVVPALQDVVRLSDPVQALRLLRPESLGIVQRSAVEAPGPLPRRDMVRLTRPAPVGARRRPPSGTALVGHRAEPCQLVAKRSSRRGAWRGRS